MSPWGIAFLFIGKCALMYKRNLKWYSLLDEWGMMQ